MRQKNQFFISGYLMPPRTDKAFFDVNVENGLCSKMEEAMFLRFYEFLNNVIYPNLSGIIYVDTPSEECIKRIQKQCENYL